MDLHPIVVHFPIAFLTLYAVLELLSVRRLIEKPYWFPIKAILVILGALGAVAALLTGEGAIHFGENIPLIEAHERFATASVILSLLISIIHLVAWFGRDKLQILAWRLLGNRGAMIPLALAMLATITITGGLGGAIVYGTDFDPLMKPIFELLGVY